MDVEICLQPELYLHDWIRMYDHLIKKHNIENINAFSRECFEIQLSIPGMVMFVGKQEGETVGAALVLIHNQVAYFHLSAFSDKGYSIRAAYGIRWKALAYGYEHGIRYFSHGGAAGLQDDPKNGLAEFKRGWSNERRTVYLCGRVFDRQIYESLCLRYQSPSTDYFPCYRGGNLKPNKSYEIWKSK
jgi:lipid II:glycine glycyltransferase (peptidoglycan interpeptide bridge formation enzyme)